VYNGQDIITLYNEVWDGGVPFQQRKS